jgi:hypothetical protein
MNYKTNQVLLPLSTVYRTPKNAHNLAIHFIVLIILVAKWVYLLVMWSSELDALVWMNHMQLCGEADAAVWRMSLLGACRLHIKVEMRDSIRK